MVIEDNASPTVAIIAPFPPPYGGMSIQAEKLYERLTKSGISTFYVRSNVLFPRCLSFLEKAKGLRSFVRFFIFLLSLIRLRKATVIHLFGASHVYFFLVVVPSILMANLMKKKVILNYRGGELDLFLKRWAFLAIPVIKKASVIAVPSCFLKEILERAVGKEVAILPNLADIRMFKYRKRHRLKPLIVVSRQLEPIYNIACALKAFKIIKEAYPAARLKIAGTGSEENKLKRLQKEMLLEGVDFAGALPHKRLFQVYDECDIMINPSNADNFPGSILEAFACGLPVVTTRVGGIPFMVKDRETGILVDVNDHKGLARGVKTLLETPELAERLSINGRNVAEEYRWEKVQRVIFEIYGINGGAKEI